MLFDPTSSPSSPPPEVLDRPGVRHRTLACDQAMAVDPMPGLTVYWRDAAPVGHVLTGADGVVRRVEPAASAPPSAPPPPDPTLRVSVVICTRDRPDELARCLASLPQQSLTPDEVIVVDNASCDTRTRTVAAEAGATYVREDRPGLDIARNTGARAATGDIVAYTDDDVLLHRRWLERLVAAFDTAAIGAVTGLVLPAELDTEAQLHFETYWSFGRGYARRDHRASATDAPLPDAWDIGAGASMAFRRTVFDKVGWFDERLDVGQAGCSGDSEFWYRLMHHGYVCRYEPTSVAFHFHRRNMSGLAFQIYHYMRGHAASLMIQYEQTGRQENRTLALRWKPLWYARRLKRALLGSRGVEDRFMKEEILGYLAGLLFYVRHRPR